MKVVIGIFNTKGSTGHVSDTKFDCSLSVTGGVANYRDGIVYTESCCPELI